MSRLKCLLAVMIIALISVSCGKKEPEKRYPNLPPKEREEVIKIDDKIKKLQKELEENLRAFQKEEGESQKEVFDQFKEFSESVKHGEKFQQKADQIRQTIIELQQKKVHILEDHGPKKSDAKL